MAVIRILLLILACAAAPWAMAQPVPAPAAPQGASSAEIERLLATLQNDAERARLTEQLRALLAAQKPEAAVPPSASAANAIGEALNTLSEAVAKSSEQIASAAGVLRDLPRTGDWLARQFGDADQLATWGQLLWKVALALAAAALAQYLVNLLLARPRGALALRRSEHLVLRIVMLVTRWLVDLLPIVVFAGIGYVVLTLLEPDRITRVIAVALINSHVVMRFVLAVARMVLVPHTGSPRPLRLSDETAAYAYVWIKRLGGVAIYGVILLEAGLLLGMPISVHNVLIRVLGLVLAGLLLVLILQNHATVANWLRSGGTEGRLPGGVGRGMYQLRRRLADIWHVLAILYLVAVYLVWALNVAGGFQYLMRATLLTVLVLLIARLLSVGLQRGIALGFSVGTDMRERLPGLEARANRYLPVVQTILRFTLYAVTLLALLQVWGMPGFSWLASDSGRRITASTLSILAVLTIAALVWEICSSLIERGLSPHDGQPQRSARIRTLLPLLRNALMVLLIIMVTLIVLSEIGLNIAPLLAGAGVAGLAIGFGAQTLVKDVITGLFMLFEDTINIGDVVEVDGGHSGVVEGMTIRTLRLRDNDGSVHTVPFSSVTSVKNMTKGFSFAVMDVSIDYATDIDRAMEVIRQVAEGLAADAAIGPLMIGPVEMLGVERFTDSAVILRCKLKTYPMQQWTVARAFRRQMKMAFDREGIVIPFPQRTVHHIMIGKDGTAEPGYPVPNLPGAAAATD